MISRSFVRSAGCSRLVSTSLQRCWFSSEDAQSKTAAVPLPVASAKVSQLAEDILALNLIEGKALADLLKERLGIPKDQPMGMPMAMPMMAAPAAAVPPPEAAEAPKEAAPKEPEKSHFDIKLEQVDEANKVKIIKEIRALMSNLSIKEAKDLVDKLPSIVKKKATKEEAEKLKAAVEALGGVVKLV